MGRTAADQEGYALDVSEYLFRLSTECLRLYSNETSSYQTLAVLVASRIEDPSGVVRHEVETMREHFTALPTLGDVRIYLTVSSAELQALDEMRLALGKRLDGCLSMADALSALLFDYIVETKTTKILDRLERESLLPGNDDGPLEPLRH